MLFDKKQLNIIDPLLLRLSHPKLSQDVNVYAYLRTDFRLKYSEAEPVVKFLKELNFIDQSRNQPFAKIRNYYITNFGKKKIFSYHDFKSFLDAERSELFNMLYSTS